MEIEGITGTKRSSDSSASKDYVNSAQYEYANNMQVKASEIKPVTEKQDFGDEKNKDEQKKGAFTEKEPSKTTLDSAMSNVNSKINKTRCEYSYDEVTRRVSIKVFDKESDELIREVPPEKSLEMLQKMWEIAGIIVDEKR